MRKHSHLFQKLDTQYNVLEDLVKHNTALKKNIEIRNLIKLGNRKEIDDNITMFDVIDYTTITCNRKCHLQITIDYCEHM